MIYIQLNSLTFMSAHFNVLHFVAHEVSKLDQVSPKISHMELSPWYKILIFCKTLAFLPHNQVVIACS